MMYKDFVKANFHKLPASMSAQEKMKKIAEAWRASGHSKNTTSKTKTKMTHKRTKAKEEGAGLFGSIGDAVDSVGSLFGFGLEKKKGRGRPRKAKGGAMAGSNPATWGPPFNYNKDDNKDKKKPEEGAGLFGSSGDAVDGVASLFGLGLEKKKGRGRPKKHTSSDLTHDELMKVISYARRMKQVKGGGFLDSFVKGLTLPFKVASVLPIPGLQQIGQAGTGVANMLGI